MRLILTRHCQTDWNTQRRWQGHTDTDLNETGRQQASQLAEKLSNLGIIRIFSSSLKRAVQTGEIISRRLGVTLLTDHRLKECGFGKLEGLTTEEMLVRHQVKIEQVFDNPLAINQDFTSFGGESPESVRQRHLSLLQEIKMKYPDETVLLIGHGRGLNVLLAALGHQPYLQQGNFQALEI